MAEMYSTFQAFRPHFDALSYVAYFKIVPKPSSELRHSLHTAFRGVVWVLVIIYNLQHVIRCIQARHSIDKAVNTLFVLLTTINTLGKQVAFNARSWRMDRLIATIQGPLFAACNAYDEEVMRGNAWVMSRLLIMYHGSIYLCGAMFGIFPLVNKLTGEVELTGYFPFDTTGWVGFGIALAFNTIVITMQGYAHVTMDCTIVSFYAQAKIQLQMLRNSLEHLADQEGRDTCQSKVYKDFDPAYGAVLNKRLTRCVEHYKLIVWFLNEVEAIFGQAMVIQFFIVAWVICMTVYKIASLSLISAEFFTMFLYLGCMLAQLFIYCYYGTQVKSEEIRTFSRSFLTRLNDSGPQFETPGGITKGRLMTGLIWVVVGWAFLLQLSEYINTSIYRCDWMSLSPRFRGLLLILMARGTRPFAPRTAYIIPMSLDTYITVLRSSYTLFTFLERK